MYGGLGDAQVANGEGGVAEAVAEGIEWRAGAVPVAGVGRFGNLGEIARIVDWDLADAARPGDGKLAAGVGIAGEEISDGVAALGAGIPGFENGGHVLRGPGDVERASI